MVLLASAYDQSRFLRAEDLAQEKTLRIKKATEEVVGNGADREKKLAIWFTNEQRGLLLNRTNNRTIRSAYGDDVEGWAGKLIVVFPTETEMRGRVVPCLRVRIPPPKAEGKRAVAGPKSSPKPPKSKPVEEESEEDVEQNELDDEIPW
jgi:hypothetical protein